MFRTPGAPRWLELRDHFDFFAEFGLGGVDAQRAIGQGGDGKAAAPQSATAEGILRNAGDVKAAGRKEAEVGQAFGDAVGAAGSADLGIGGGERNREAAVVGVVALESGG